MKIAIIGNGDLSKQILGFVKPAMESSIVYFDDFHRINNLSHFSFLDWKNELFSDHYFIVGLGYKNLNIKNKLVSELNILNRNQHSATLVLLLI
jgi:hypothetical protein